MVVNSPFCDFSAILSEVGKVDAAIVDLFFNGEVAGIEMVRCIKKEIKCPVLVLTSHAEPEWMIEARQAGADSFLDKRNLDELPKVLLSTLGPCPFWSVSSVQILLDEHARVLAEARAKILTHMEKQILSLIHQGHTQSQVAVKLYIEERTVKNHINRILKKLKAKSSRDAASIAYSKGMLIS